MLSVNSEGRFAQKEFQKASFAGVWKARKSGKIDKMSYVTNALRLVHFFLLRISQQSVLIVSKDFDA